MACVLTSSGCLDIGDDNQEIVDDNKQEPVGETNMTSLEKRIIDLEAKILEYEQPKAYFQEFGGDDVSFTDGSVNLADDGNLFCTYNEYSKENRCNLSTKTKATFFFIGNEWDFIAHMPKYRVSC